MGGGKGGTTTSTVSIPPEVLARYNAVNARAEDVAKAPFQPYTGQFVAGITPTQQAGITGTSAAAGLAQPFYGAGAQYTQQGAQAVGPLTKQQISYYQDPFTQAVVDPTVAALQQEQGQQRAALSARQASTGAFGGDRSGLERANLARQQGLGMAQAIAPLYSQGYQTGVQTAAGQQGVIASDLQRRLAAGQQIAGLGTGAQAAALQGAQAQIGAGTLEQQTKQADLTAQYQQYLQQQGYPFQVAQFLANIAMGTGALSGSTTTTQQPSGFFSDRRLKHDVHEIGKTNDGLPIYSFKYNGDNKTQIGLMAQDVEKKHPEAVGVMGGYKTVDYGKATEDSERPERAFGGSSMGGGVWHPDAYAGGGLVDSDDMKAILQAQQAGFGPFAGGLHGGFGQGTPGAKTPGVVPQASLPVPKLVTAGAAPARQASGLSQAASVGANLASTGRAAVDFKNWVSNLGKDKPATGTTEAAKTGVTAPATTGKADLPSAKARDVTTDPSAEVTGFKVPGVTPTLQNFDQPTVTPPDATPDLEGFFAQGGVIPRYHRAPGGVLPYKTAEDFEYIPSAVLQEGEQEAEQAAGQFKKNAASGSGGGGGGGGLGSAIGTIGSLYGAAKGIGALASLLPFSDERLKNNIKKVGKTFDGQNIYSYNLGEGQTQLGLLAQEVLHHKPDAVGKDHGYLTVDYDKAVEDAAHHHATGGVVPSRGHYDDGGPTDQPQYKIAPQALEDMPEHRQELIKGIYGPESGGRYDIRYGGKGSSGKTFDPEKGHPNIPEVRDDGRTSTAAGAGQFLKSTWDDVTGGAPMTKPYMDAATWTLANRDYAKRTGRDLDTDLKEQGFSPAIKSALSGTWEGLGPRMASADRGVVPSKIGRESSLGDVFKSVTSESIPSGENFWIPALSGIGSMLASNRPTFLGALGEGLVGGVSGYQTMQKQHADMAKGVMDIIKSRFTRTIDDSGNTVFYDTMTGRRVQPDQVINTAAGMFTNLGIDPRSYGFTPQAPTAPTAPTVPGTAPAVTAEAKQPSVKDQPKQPSPDASDATKVSTTPAININEMNPGQLDAYARQNPSLYGLDKGPNNIIDLQNQEAALRKRAAMLRVGDPEQAPQANAAIQEAEKIHERIDKYVANAISEQVLKNKAFAESSSKAVNDRLDEIGKRSTKLGAAESDLKLLANVVANFETGRSAELRANIGSWLKDTGLIRLLPEGTAEKLRNAPGSADLVAKEAMQAAMQDLVDNHLVRAPVGGVKAELAKLPNISSDPSAAYALIARMLGEVRQKQSMDTDYAKEKFGTDPRTWEQKWLDKKENKLDYHVNQAFKELPRNNAIPRERLEELERTWGPFVSGIQPSAAPKSTEKAAPAAPAAPKAGTVQDGFRFKGGDPASPSNWEKVQ